MVLAADELLPQRIEHSTLRHLLSTATTMPIACDVPILDSSDDYTARGLRIELIGLLARATVLLVYANHQHPSAIDQISDMEQLTAYAESSHSVAQLLLIGEDESQPLPPAPGLTQTQVSAATPFRGSLNLFHLDLDLHATCYRIANESRRLLGCDRATVLIVE